MVERQEPPGRLPERCPRGNRRRRGLGCPYLVVTARELLPDTAHAVKRQRLVDVLTKAAAQIEGRPVTLLLENINSRVDHVGTFLASTATASDVLAEVGSAQVRLLYDQYHSRTMGEQPASVLAGHADHLGHVQIAEVPGRHEPGTGGIDWKDELLALRSLYYTGPIGLEYVPTKPTSESLICIDHQ